MATKSDLKRQRVAVVQEIGELERKYCDPCKKATTYKEKRANRDSNYICKGCSTFEKLQTLGQKLIDISNQTNPEIVRNEIDHILKHKCAPYKLKLTPLEFVELKVIEKLTHEQIADMKGVHKCTITKWKAKNKKEVDKIMQEIKDTHKGA